MAETGKKGLLGKLFGRKSKTKEEEPAELQAPAPSATAGEEPVPPEERSDDFELVADKPQDPSQTVPEMPAMTDASQVDLDLGDVDKVAAIRQSIDELADSGDFELDIDVRSLVVPLEKLPGLLDVIESAKAEPLGEGASPLRDTIPLDQPVVASHLETDEEMAQALEELEREGPPVAVSEEEAEVVADDAEELKETLAAEFQVPTDFPDQLASAEPKAQVAAVDEAPGEYELPETTVYAAEEWATGLRDLPFSDGSKDKLGMDEYALALARFVQTCQTPITIAVRGGAGSGKTSFMNLVDEKLDRSSATPIRFNAWHYGQFHASDELPFLLIAHVLRQIDKRLGQGKDDIRRKLADASNLVKRLSMQRESAGATVGDMMRPEEPEQPQVSPGLYDAVDQLKDQLKLIVEQSLGRGMEPRYVVFIDDLNRLSRAHASRFIDMLKVFLDINGFVFLIACDSRFMDKGSEQREFHADEARSRADGFEHKAFQLSFNMPTPMYRIDEYLSDLLERTGYQADENEDRDMEDFMNLVKYSVGPNPREIKLVVNNFSMLSMLPTEASSADEDERLVPGDQHKTLFGVICMQRAFGTVYKLLLEKLDDPEGLADFIDAGLNNEEKIARANEDFGLFPSDEKGRMIGKLNGFMNVFLGLFDSDTDRRLEWDEIESLRAAIRLVSLASPIEAMTLEDDPRRRAMLSFAGQVKDKISGLEAAPNRGNTCLQGSRRRPWYGLWYADRPAKKAWGMDSAYYFIRFDVDYYETVSLGLRLRMDGLKRHNVPASAVQKMADLQFWQDKGYQYNKLRRDQVEMVKDLEEISYDPDPEIREEELERVACELIELAEATHRLFDVETGRPVADQQPRSADIQTVECPGCGKQYTVKIPSGAGQRSFKCKNPDCGVLIRVGASAGSEELH